MKYMRHITPLILLFLIISGCELYLDDGYEERYSVQSYLIANEHLPEVRLTKTLPIEENFDQQTVAVTDARVEIRLLNPDSSIARRFHYLHSRLGLYLPEDSLHTFVKAAKPYQLYVTLPDGKELKATTFVPGDFKALKKPKDRYRYQHRDKVAFLCSPSSYPNRQAYYLFTAQAGHPKEEDLTPYYRDLVKNKGAWINSYFINNSEISSQGKYQSDAEGNLQLEIPWSVFAFYGPNKIIVNAIDDNIYDYLRFHDELTDGTTLNNGEVQSVRYNIEGGIGIFGSMARVSTKVELLKAGS